MAAFAGPSKGGPAELFLRANADEAELTQSHNYHADTEFRYDIDGTDVVCLQRTGWEPTTWKTFYAGPMVDFIHTMRVDLERVTSIHGWLRTESLAVARVLEELQMAKKAIDMGWIGNAGHNADTARAILAPMDPDQSRFPDCWAAHRALCALAAHRPMESRMNQEAKAVAVVEEPAPVAKAAGPVKFNKYHVTNGAHKVRVYYSLGADSVTITERSYAEDLSAILPEGYRNDSDSMTDYFAHGHTTLRPGMKHYTEARARAELENKR